MAAPNISNSLQAIDLGLWTGYLGLGLGLGLDLGLGSRLRLDMSHMTNEHKLLRAPGPYKIIPVAVYTSSFICSRYIPEMHVISTIVLIREVSNVFSDTVLPSSCTARA